MDDHVLIVRPGALGDSILTLPVVHAFRLAGARKITVLGTLHNWAFIKPGVDGLFIREFSSVDCLGLFNSGPAQDSVLPAWLANVNSAVVYLSGDNEIVARNLKRAGVGRAIFIPPPVNQSNGLHAARQMLDPLAEWLGEAVCLAALNLNDARADLFIEISESAGGLPANILPGFIAVHPGSGGVRKCWPAERFAELVLELSARGANPVVVFGPADEKVRTRFNEFVPRGVEYPRLESLPIRSLLQTLCSARLYIGNDSGVAHLAARACPVLAIFGPTNPKIWAPLGNDVRIASAPSGNLDALTVAEVLRLSGPEGPG